MQKNAPTICVFRKKAVILQPICAMAEPKTHTIDLSTLEIGQYSFDYVLDSAYLTSIEHTELLGGEVAAKAWLTLRERDFDLTISVHGSVQVTCDRCLSPMTVDVDVTEPMNLEDEGEDASRVKALDLDWLAYELIIVNLPLVHSHQSGGCDPAMDALLQNHLCTEVEDDTDSEDEAK